MLLSLVILVSLMAYYKAFADRSALDTFCSIVSQNRLSKDQVMGKAKQMGLLSADVPSGDHPEMMEVWKVMPSAQAFFFGSPDAYVEFSVDHLATGCHVRTSWNQF